MWRFRQIVEGLEHIHEQNICHRDLKPANIFLMCAAEGDDEVKLGDFGLATEGRTETEEEGVGSSDGLVGTLLYVAPEAEHTSPGVKGDMFAAGVCTSGCLHLTLS